MEKNLFYYLCTSSEGYILSKSLKNRGTFRRGLSLILTKFMRKRLKEAKKGCLSLPIYGSSKLPPISLTSYPLRYDSLPLVLLNLLDQSKLPEKIYVWLSYKDYKLLDPEIIELFQASIVEFHQTQNYGCHKKWLPLATVSNQPFVICDDDIFYPKHWYESLINSDDGQSCTAHRCHLMRISPDVKILPYASWDKDIQSFGQSSYGLFPVGCGGVLIFPERISSRFRDWHLISNACPKADDVWLKLAHLESGVYCKKSLYSFPCIEYANSQAVSLMHTNVDLGYNDIQIKHCLSELQLDLRKYFK
ncbi:hypothetical protein NIES2100_16030 [Calothrix sp. NIES-2100]|uniref:hypothetical protein n=1 Tax=Calothrix sp. NIES-2100 TaxID=1954172 RepID=UPI000B618AFB|nr:hypothetical protein NIES2100_16030 [Calothrix sp. NIES-2100]